MVVSPQVDILICVSRQLGICVNGNNIGGVAVVDVLDSRLFGRAVLAELLWQIELNGGGHNDVINVNVLAHGFLVLADDIRIACAHGGAAAEKHNARILAVHLYAVNDDAVVGELADIFYRLFLFLGDCRYLLGNCGSCGNFRLAALICGSFGNSFLGDYLHGSCFGNFHGVALIICHHVYAAIKLGSAYALETVQR